MNSRTLLVLLLLLLPACRSGGDPVTEDPFFCLPLAEEQREAPAVAPAAVAAKPVAPPPAPGGIAYRVEMRFHRLDGAVIVSPSLVVHPERPAIISLVDQISYIEDFDVEIACTPLIADPVVGTVRIGIQAEVSAAPIEGTDRVALRWAFEQSGLIRPVRERSIPLGPQAQPITIQLPSAPVTRCEGRTMISPGEEVLLATTPVALETGVETTRVTVRIEPVRLAAVPALDVPLDVGPDPDLGVFLGSAPGVHTLPSLLGPADPNAPPPSDGWLEIIVAEMSDDPAEDYLDPVAAARPLKRFEIRAGAESGTKVACRLTRAYLSGYKVVSNQGQPPVDPQVDHFEAGFSAAFESGGSAPTLAWRFSTYFLVEDFTSSVPGTELVLPHETPLLTGKAGTLTLSGDESSMEMARTEDGSRILLVVRRIHDADGH